MAIMLLQSHTFKDAVSEGGMCLEFNMPYSASIVEHALDYIYGSVYYVGDKKTSTIPLELYNVFAMLQTDHLLNHNYYKIHDFPLDTITYTSIKNNTLRGKLIDWLLTIDMKGYPPKLVRDSKLAVCNALGRFRFELPTDSTHIALMTKFDIETLRMFLEAINMHYMGSRWIIMFLGLYTSNNPDYNTFRNVILPRASIVSLADDDDGKRLIQMYGLPTDIKGLIEFQLQSGYFYDSRYQYELIKRGEYKCTVRVTKSTFRTALNHITVATVDLDALFIDLVLTSHPQNFIIPTDVE